MRNGLMLTGGLLLAVLGAGCGREESASNNAPPAPSTPVTPTPAPSAAGGVLTDAELDGVAKAAKPFKLALIVKTRNNPFFDPMIKSAEAEAKALGVELAVEAPAQETDKERQFAMVQDVTARGVQAILIAPADSKGIVPALKQAQDKGVLVINLDNRVDSAAAQSAGLKLDGYVGADNEAGGRLAGEEMVAALNGKGKVAVLEGIRGAVQGKLDVAASDTAEWDTQKAYAKCQSMLAAHPDVTGLFCANDKMALGAIKAIAEGGSKGKVTVIGYDNIPDVQPYLKDGQLHATIEQHPDLMGKYGVRLATGALGGSLPKGKEYLVKLELKKK